MLLEFLVHLLLKKVVNLRITEVWMTSMPNKLSSADIMALFTVVCSSGEPQSGNEMTVAVRNGVNVTINIPAVAFLKPLRNLQGFISPKQNCRGRERMEGREEKKKKAHPEDAGGLRSSWFKAFGDLEGAEKKGVQVVFEAEYFNLKIFYS